MPGKGWNCFIFCIHIMETEIQVWQREGRWEVGWLRFYSVGACMYARASIRPCSNAIAINCKAYQWHQLQSCPLELHPMNVCKVPLLLLFKYMDKPILLWQCFCLVRLICLMSGSNANDFLIFDLRFQYFHCFWYFNCNLHDGSHQDWKGGYKLSR